MKPQYFKKQVLKREVVWGGEGEELKRNLKKGLSVVLEE